MTVSTSIHVAAHGLISLFFMTEESSIIYMHHIFIHSSVDRHLDCFHKDNYYLYLFYRETEMTYLRKKMSESFIDSSELHMCEVMSISRRVRHLQDLPPSCLLAHLS